ncbi:MAG TPA: hypothetical protein V6C58_04260 [Allocoleopsis sp.]
MFKTVPANLPNIEIAVQYGLIKIQEFVDAQLESEDQDLEDMLEVLVIRRIIKNVRENAELDDYVSFLDSVLNYLDNEYKEIVDFENNQISDINKQRALVY